MTNHIPTSMLQKNLKNTQKIILILTFQKMINEFEKTTCSEMNAILDLILMNRLLKLPPKTIECKPRIYEKIESWSKRQTKTETEISSIMFDGVEIRKGTFLMSNPFQIVEFYGNI